MHRHSSLVPRSARGLVSLVRLSRDRIAHVRDGRLIGIEEPGAYRRPFPLETAETARAIEAARRGDSIDLPPAA